jgi:hypothetical protein
MNPKVKRLVWYAATYPICLLAVYVGDNDGDGSYGRFQLALIVLAAVMPLFFVYDLFDYIKMRRKVESDD